MVSAAGPGTFVSLFPGVLYRSVCDKPEERDGDQHGKWPGAAGVLCADGGEKGGSDL